MAKASVTAGLKWAPLIPPETQAASITANAQPKTLISQLSGPNGTVCRPEPGRPTVFTAQVPSPSSNSTKVPKNSASMAPAIPARSRVKVECVGDRSAVKVVNALSPTRSWLLGQLLANSDRGNPPVRKQTPWL